MSANVAQTRRVCDNPGQDDCTFTSGFARIRRVATGGQMGYSDQFEGERM